MVINSVKKGNRVLEITWRYFDDQVLPFLIVYVRPNIPGLTSITSDEIFRDQWHRYSIWNEYDLQLKSLFVRVKQFHAIKV